ncbi:MULTISPECIES: LacI family DNA-binding transcriptional regulator [unclassified Streptomyces]|uniref:LacI family DNA-binding transcriptional regulator n=1 Tax=unclassified Streptomyces TaxID=2593676 RepID=UPI0033287BEC
MTVRHRTAVTARMVAEEAGVSPATVSKVMNGRPGVAPATREWVEHVLRRHHERRRPRPRTALVVDLALNVLDSLWSLEVVRGAEEVLSPTGASMAVTALHADTDRTAAWLDRLTRRPCDGVILVMSEPSPRQRLRLVSAGVPMVIMDPAGGAGTGLHTVAAANWSGAEAATEHLLGLGHRRIAHLAGPADVPCGRARADGYRSAIRRAGLRVPGDWVIHGGFDRPSGHDGALALFDTALRSGHAAPTAVFAASDHQALGALTALRSRGLRVPQDISVIGFDDLPLAAFTDPPLTTVRQPVADMAGFAARVLLRLIDGDPVHPPRTELPTRLIIRESTAPPSSG